MLRNVVVEDKSHLSYILNITDKKKYVNYRKRSDLMKENQNMEGENALKNVDKLPVSKAV